MFTASLHPEKGQIHRTGLCRAAALQQHPSLGISMGRQICWEKVMRNQKMVWARKQTQSSTPRLEEVVARAMDKLTKADKDL